MPREPIGRRILTESMVGNPHMTPLTPGLGTSPDLGGNLNTFVIATDVQNLSYSATLNAGQEAGLEGRIVYFPNIPISQYSSANRSYPQPVAQGAMFTCPQTAIPFLYTWATMTAMTTTGSVLLTSRLVALPYAKDTAGLVYSQRQLASGAKYQLFGCNLDARVYNPSAVANNITFSVDVFGMLVLALPNG